MERMVDNVKELEAAMAEAPRWTGDRLVMKDFDPNTLLQRIEAAAALPAPERWPEWTVLAQTAKVMAERARSGDETAFWQLMTVDQGAALHMALIYDPDRKRGAQVLEGVRKGGATQKGRKHNGKRNTEIIEAAWEMRSRNADKSVRDISERLAPRFNLGVEAIRKIIGPALRAVKSTGTLN